MRKTFDVETEFATYKDCYFMIAHYAMDNSLALEIWNDEDGPIADLTRCLGNAKENESYLDMNNCPWARDLVNKLGIGKFTGVLQGSGFCIYPLYEFDIEKVKEYGVRQEEVYDD